MRQTYRNLGRNGRLGNQLFQIAGTIGRAHRADDHGRATFPPWRYAPYFTIPDLHFTPIPPGERSIDGGHDYLQRLSEFEDCDAYIREIFAPSELATHEASLLRPRPSGHVTAVHVRRGDYLALTGLVTVCPLHYFTRAMDDMRRRHPGTHFMVFSDDAQWCTDHLAGPADVRVVQPTEGSEIQNEMADFTSMRSADAFIISNSTYSWWAAYLSEKPDVICPAKWFDGPSPVHVDDIIPESWQRNSIDPIGPMRRPSLRVALGENGYIVTDELRGRLHHLNPTSTLLYELCTGSNTRTDIAEAMGALFPDDVWKDGLVNLIELGIVTDVP